MRNVWRGVGVCGVLVGFGVLAVGSGKGAARCEHLASAPSVKTAAQTSAQLEAAAKALSDRERELSRVRAELEAATAREDHEEALALGVVDAVKASGLPERQQRRVAVAIVREARRNGLDPLLVVAVIRVESSFNNYAVSPVGARGLMQVMPATGKWLLDKRGRTLGRAENLFDPELNVELGAFYLADMIRIFGSVDKALVAYNAGPGGAKKILASATVRPKFMAGYPAKVLGEHRKLRREAESRMAVQAEAPVPDVRG